MHELSLSYPDAPHAPQAKPLQEEVDIVLTRTPTGLAAGPSGLRAEHLSMPVVYDSLGESLTSIIVLPLEGSLPECQRPYLCGGQVVPLLKKDRGIRPLVVGECLRALIVMPLRPFSGL